MSELARFNWKLCEAYLKDAEEALRECVEHLEKALGNLEQVKGEVEAMADLDELQDKADEAEYLKVLVLKILHLEGIIAFDASESTLAPEWEKVIKGHG